MVVVAVIVRCPPLTPGLHHGAGCSWPVAWQSGAAWPLWKLRWSIDLREYQLLTRELSIELHDP